MAVFYVDRKENPWNVAGQGLTGLAALLQNLGQGQNNKILEQKKQQVIAEPDPNKQADLAMRLLGPDQGGELVQKLTQARLAKYALSKAQTDEKLGQLDIAEKTEQNREQPLLLQLAQKKAQSEAALQSAERTAALARAAAIPSEIEETKARTAEARTRTQQIDQEIQNSLQFQKVAMAAAQGLKDDLPAPDGSPAPPTQIQPKHVASIDDFLLGRTNNVSDVQLPAIELSAGAGNKNHLTPDQIAQIQRAAAAGDKKEFLKVFDDAGKIIVRQDKTIAPGFKLKVGVRSDGSEVPLGTVRYEPNKTNLAVDSRTAQGIATWNALVDGIGKIVDNKSSGTQATRMLMDTIHKTAPWVDLQSWFGKAGQNYYDWEAQAGHSLIAASSMLAARQNKELMRSMGGTIPNFSMPINEVLAKLRGSKRVTYSMAKDLYGSLRSDGKAVPEELADIIKSNNLDKLTTPEIASPGVVDGGEKEGVSRGGEGGSAGEGEGGATPLAGEGERAPTASGKDIIPTRIGGKLITPEYVNKLAKEHNMTPQEVLKGLEDAAK